MATIESAFDDYIANAGYAENDSLTEAKAFVTACTRLLLMPVSSRSRPGSELSFSTASIERAKEKAERWVSNKTRGSAGGFRLGDLRSFER